MSFLGSEGPSSLPKPPVNLIHPPINTHVDTFELRQVYQKAATFLEDRILPMLSVDRPASGISHIQIYPMSTLLCLFFLADLKDTTQQNTIASRNSLLTLLLELLDDLKTLSLIKAISRQSIHHNCLLQIIKFADDVESQYPDLSSVSWSEYLRTAMEIDIRILEEMLQRQALPWKRHLWPSLKDKCHDEQELSSLSQIVQHFIDRRSCYTNRFCEYLMHIVKSSAIFPRYLFTPEIKLTENHPRTGGGFADIWMGELNCRPVALKILRYFTRHRSEQEKKREEIRDEAIIWRQFDHPNVMQFIGLSEQHDMALVSPWMYHGDTLKYLGANTSVDRLELIDGIAQGITYLHTTFKVAHGDLRASNILIDDKGSPRIGDFGLAKFVDLSDEYLHTGKGSPRWQAPECLLENKYCPSLKGITTEADVYAFACVCLEIFTEEMPFSYLGEPDTVIKVAMFFHKPLFPGDAAVRRGLTEPMWLRMMQCWNKDPNERPKMTEILVDLRQEAQAMEIYKPMVTDYREDPFMIPPRPEKTLGGHYRMRKDGQISGPSSTSEDTEELHELAMNTLLYAKSALASWNSNYSSCLDPHLTPILPFSSTSTISHAHNALQHPYLERFRWTGRRKRAKLPKMHEGHALDSRTKLAQLQESRSIPYISYNILDRSYTLRMALGAFDIHTSPATERSKSSLCIVSQAFPWFIHVVAQDEKIGVSCAEVLDSIKEFFDQLLPFDEYEALDDAQKQALRENFWKNRKDSQRRRSLGPGLRRLDWFGGPTFFRGLRRDESRKEYIYTRTDILGSGFGFGDALVLDLGQSLDG